MSNHNPVLKAGWFLTLILSPFGNTSLGLLVVLLGVLLSWRRGEWHPEIQDEAHWFFGALLATMVVSAILSPVRRVAGLLTLGYALLVFGFVFGAQWLATAYTSLRDRLVLAVVLGSAGSNLYAIGYYLIHRPERTLGLLTGFNGLGTLIVLYTGVSLGYLLNLRGGWRRLTLPYLAVAFSALLLTFSRGAWLGFLGMIATFALINRCSRRWAVAGLLAVLLVLAGVPTVAERFLTSFQPSANLSRLYIWRSTLMMIKDYPLFGVGAGAFMHVYPRYVLPGAPEPVAAFAHNLFLQVLAEFGLVGFVVFVAILGRVMWMSWQLARTGNVFYQGIFAALVGVLIHQQVDIPIWGLEIGGAFWTMVGLVIALYHRELGPGSTALAR